MQFRHGDLLIEKVKSIPISVKVKENNIIAEGEVTGHSHRLEGGTVLIDIDGDIYLQILESSGTLVHQEHSKIELPPGEYVVIRQKEWNPYEQVIRRVAD